MDTPEVRGEDKARGLKVRDMLRSWIPAGSTVLIRTLEAKDGAERTGSFHRYLAIVCPRGWTESVNARLLREGLAVVDAHTAAERADIARWFGLGETESGAAAPR